MAGQSDIEPFKIAVPDSAIKLLKNKLAVSTFPDESEFSDGWAFGASLSDIKRLAKRWQDGFDWRKHEAKLNELPQFTTAISVDGFDDLMLHFVHQRSSKPGAIPLLFCHGWPGSFLEVTKILSLLTEPENGQAFHVVAPSLPNFGFSDGVSKPGFSIPQYAEVMHNVMLKLGYRQYVNQGGDWGYNITRLMGVLFPESCLATHINFAYITEPPSTKEDPLQAAKSAVQPYTEEEKAGIERSQWLQKEGIGYNLLQSTKPSTLAFALRDSPVALLAWIYEKLHDWTDSYPWTDDEVLTWISIYQFSKAGPQASAYIYYESVHSHKETTKKGYGYIPGIHLGVSIFPKDLAIPPSAWVPSLGPIVFLKRHPEGGHFAAYEKPEALTEDLREMFKHDMLDEVVRGLAKL
ncbi:epoxide hydrolase [Fusarium oxysporum f. sp. phaseoli]